MSLKLALALGAVSLLSMASAQAQDPGGGSAALAGGAGGYADPFTVDTSLAADPLLSSPQNQCVTDDFLTAWSSIVCLFSAGYMDALVNPFCYASAAGMLWSPVCGVVLDGGGDGGGPYRLAPEEQ